MIKKKYVKYLVSSNNLRTFALAFKTYKSGYGGRSSVG